MADKSIFAELTNREMVQHVIAEMRRRNLIGCVFLFPETGGHGTFGSSSPADSLRDLSAACQLDMFAEIAAEGVEQTRQIQVETPTSQLVN